MEYSEQTMKHFQNPRNMGEIENADGVGEVGNLRCGDIMKIYIKVGKRPKKKYDAYNPPAGGSQKEHRSGYVDSRGQEEYIEDIKFKTLGCAAAIAASSMMTELAKGKSLEEAEKISRDDVNNSLGKLPAQKYHCSILSAEGIKKAIEDYRLQNHKSQITS